jgi:hypothetical protein
MKSLIRVVTVAAVIAAPVAAFAQSNPQTVTRAQVRAELVQAENAGYSPLDWADYPYGEVQAAEYRAAVHNRSSSDTGYGAGLNGTSQSGAIAR